MKLNSVIPVLCALTALLASAGTASLAGAFLCIGADGHRDIEFFSEGCCLPSTAGDLAAISDMDPSQHPCGECVDLPLGMQLGCSLDIRFASPGQDAAAITSTLALRAAADDTTRSARKRDVLNRPRYPLALLATVVLLT